MRKVIHAFALIVLPGLLVACAQPTTAPATQTPHVITVVVTATPEPSATPTMTATVTPTSTPYPKVTPRPTLTPYPSPTPIALSNSKPTTAEILRFVHNHYAQDEEAQNRKTEEFFYDISRQELDVNSDGQPEIILTGEIHFRESVFLIILGNPRGSEWQEMFYLQEYGHYCADIRASVIGNKIIADINTCWGGTGLFETKLDQHWILCEKVKCRDVWSGVLLNTKSEHGPSYGEQVGIATRNLTQLDEHTLEIITHRFKTIQFSYGAIEDNDADGPALAMRRISGPDERQVYRWNGTTYALIQNEQISPGIEITREFDLQTQETDYFLSWDLIMPPFRIDLGYGGTWDWDRVAETYAAFWGMPHPVQTNRTWPSRYGSFEPIAATTDKVTQKIAGVIVAKDRPICRLTAQRYDATRFELIGRRDIPCSAEFTRMFWEDIDSDGVKELLILTIRPHEINHQRLYIYRADRTLDELATMDGTINGADGVGIKWETTHNGFRLFVGVPIIARTNCSGFECITFDRRFQTYLWDKASNKFVPASP